MLMYYKTYKKTLICTSMFLLKFIHSVGSHMNVHALLNLNLCHLN